MDEQRAPETKYLLEVIEVLNTLAYSGDDEAEHLWEMKVNPWVWSITASTRDRHPDAESAQAAANELAAALVDASHARLHENGAETRQGSHREVPLGEDAAVFRGFVEVRLHL